MCREQLWDEGTCVSRASDSLAVMLAPQPPPCLTPRSPAGRELLIPREAADLITGFDYHGEV